MRVYRSTDWRIVYSLAGLLVNVAAPAESFQAGVYDISTQTVMPHLEENLHYAISHERRCVQQQDLPLLFLILRQDSFAGCGLKGTHQTAGSVQLSLECKSKKVATGSARLFYTPEYIRGELEIKMGGKNMTFSQRIEGIRVDGDECKR